MAREENSIRFKTRDGNVLTPGSYDIRQEINAKVIGVFNYNSDFRKTTLDRNIGTYNYVNDTTGIGSISNTFSIKSSKPFYFGEEGLLGYTHIYESDYQKLINQKYNIGDFIEYYKHVSPSNEKNLRWNGLYDNYIEYANKTFGNPLAINAFNDLFNGLDINSDYSEKKFLTIQSVLNNFIQYDNIKFAMERTKIGVIKPNPYLALQGVVTTNINNFDNTDSKLGLITNYVYANTLKNSAHFNTIRQTKYITPSVYDLFGNKLHTISTLGSDFRINDYTGRLAYDYSEGIYFQDYSKNEYIEDNISNLSKTYNINDYLDIPNVTNSSITGSLLTLRVRELKNEYLPFKNKRYDDLIENKTVKLLTGLSNEISKTYKIWDEGDIENNNSIISSVAYNDNVYETLNGNLGDGLIAKTNELFKKHGERGIDTPISRFHTTGGRDKHHNEVSLFQTAVSNYGMSKGRNLLTKTAYENKEEKFAEKTNGYSNPYCRTWTNHHQYGNTNNLIRPFGEDISSLQSTYKKSRSESGVDRLSDNTTLNQNGFVNITPSVDSKVDVTKCMFSIENLAWKDVIKENSSNGKRALHKSQIGPNGGRIMWFPPYGLKFNENVSVNWNPNEFIGRGERIYTYTNTERTGTLSFILLVDYPSVVDVWKKNGRDLSQNDNDNEQTLLRFFAGCDKLSIDNKEIVTEIPIFSNSHVINNIPIQDVEIIENDPLLITDEIIEDIDDEIIDTEIVDNEVEEGEEVFYIYFPNNYSGRNSEPLNDKINYLIDYYEGNNEVNPDYCYEEGYKWGYWVDDEFLTQKLKYEDNYKDNKNYSLNIKISNDATCSFSEFIEKVSNLNVISASIKGFASSHGYNNKNNSLVQGRVNFAKEVLINKASIDIDKITVDEDSGILAVDTIDINNVSGLSSKLARSVKVVVRVEKKKITEDITDLTLEDGVTTFSNNIENNSSNNKVQERALIENYGDKSNNIVDSTNNLLYNYNNGEGSLDKLLSNTRIVNAEKTIKMVTNDDYERWEDESQYFKMLEKNDSFLYSKLIDKVKYFNPAFHSITPEGFNSRLGFLHQCTRQGSTMSVSDNNVWRSSGNMAFGRAPICVLRVGDFYHTKIIIESITIDYDTQQWDMNPESIGMQPMYAQINLNFKFLGGSDLGAPISRLQNALSFNFYANQSVYDDRADIGEYDKETKKPKISGNPWVPNLDIK